jgi:zinc/manganese transport system substrate-binding protein
MQHVVDAIVTFLDATVDELESETLLAAALRYKGDLGTLDEEIRALVEPLPADDRILVTNHDVFGYFAERYGFEVVGAIHESTSTLGEPSAADLADLAETVRRTGVPAVFTEASSGERLADALAREAGRSVEVVELYAESLGDEESEAGTYIDLMRTNAERIVEALSR